MASGRASTVRLARPPRTLPSFWPKLEGAIRIVGGRPPLWGGSHTGSIDGRTMPMDGDSGIARDEADAIPPSDDALAAPGPGPSSAEEGDGGTTRDPEGNWEGAVATAQRMVAAMGDAMRGEFRLPKMEYQLLGRMNRLAADKYADMADFAAGL